jgi:hypothetical protein
MTRTERLKLAGCLAYLMAINLLIVAIFAVAILAARELM